MYYFYPKVLLRVIAYNSFLHRDFLKVRSIRVSTHYYQHMGASQMVVVVKKKKKKPSANAGDIKEAGSVLGLGRCPGEGNGNPLQNFCLENPMDRRT